MIKVPSIASSGKSTDLSNKSSSRSMVLPAETEIVQRDMLNVTSQNMLNIFDKFRARFSVSSVTRQEVVEATTEVIRMHREAAVAEYADQMRLRGMRHQKWFHENMREIIMHVQNDLIEEDKRLTTLLVDTMFDVLKRRDSWVQDGRLSELSPESQDVLRSVIDQSSQTAAEHVTGRISDYMESYQQSFRRVFQNRLDQLKP